jgi:NAD(P)-dependent dehydrogenase (short-subunit alcohol dehydrogenase family)
MGKLAGKIAVITGGATGIGFGAAQRFIEEGAHVYLFGRRQDALDAAVEKLGPNARAVRGSVAEAADLDRLYETIRSEHERVDIVFANAGTGSFVPLGDISLDHYVQTFDVNVKGVLLTVQKALPLMSSGGSIILTGSTTGVMGTPQFSIYSASKAAVRNLARSWALDLQGTGIRVNVLSPGPTKTELAISVLGEEQFDAIGASTPLGRVGAPSETGAVAAFLASSDSSFMTGGEVFVDGGFAQV